MVRFLIILIKSYQKYIAPFSIYHCRFYPSCSQYSIEAFQKKGVFRGMLLTIGRVLRCNPFSRGGYDPMR